MIELAYEFLKRLGYLWYIMDPRDHLYDKVESVPDYYKEITPAYIFLIILEQAVLLVQGKDIMRLNDTVTNISQGILMEMCKIPMYRVELIVYAWVYNNWRICTLPWNSIWTWFICLILSDLCFYWAHRAVHQISILWLFHETHHSSEDFNLTIPFRLSIFHNLSLWFTYVPLALAIPPSIYLVHFQLNVIFQFWLHTEVIKSVGVLEYIFVTPSHHRVHHGRNRRCIDKNFGSIFILWDKLFGTFEPEGKELITYGITKPLRTFGPVSVQMNYLRTIWQRLNSAHGFSNKVSCIVKGPGWAPGKPWLGDTMDISEPKENGAKYDPKLPKRMKIYVIMHTTLLIMGHFFMILNLSKMSTLVLLIYGSYMVFTTIGLGSVLDLSIQAPIIEFIRCFAYFIVDAVVENEFKRCCSISMLLYICKGIFMTSTFFWIFESSFAIPLSLK